MPYFLFLFFILSTLGFAQQEFYKPSNNMVIERGDYGKWNDHSISDPKVIFVADTFRMWFTGRDIHTYSNKIGYAWSVDGRRWEVETTAVLTGTSYSWDEAGIETVTIVYDSNAVMNPYKMWYVGSRDMEQATHSIYWHVGYAWSEDGTNWVKYPSPVLTANIDSASLDHGSLEGPSVILDKDTLRMYYAGFADIDQNMHFNQHFNINYAWSLDGVNWHKKLDRPVLEVGPMGSWDAHNVQDPEVLKIGEQYHMWYGGNASDDLGQQIGYAYSKDGLNWQKSNANPILTTGKKGNWDEHLASYPTVVQVDSTFMLWYTGLDNCAIDPKCAEHNIYQWNIGYARQLQQNLLSENPIKEKNKYMELKTNPLQEYIYIKLGETLEHHTELGIYNVNGNKIKSIPSNGQTIIKVDKKGFDKGAYLFQLEDQRGEVALGKFYIY